MITVVIISDDEKDAENLIKNYKSYFQSLGYSVILQDSSSKLPTSGVSIFVYEVLSPDFYLKLPSKEERKEAYYFVVNNYFSKSTKFLLHNKEKFDATICPSIKTNQKVERLLIKSFYLPNIPFIKNNRKRSIKIASEPIKFGVLSTCTNLSMIIYALANFNYPFVLHVEGELGKFYKNLIEVFKIKAITTEKLDYSSINFLLISNVSYCINSSMFDALLNGVLLVGTLPSFEIEEVYPLFFKLETLNGDINNCKSYTQQLYQIGYVDFELLNNGKAVTDSIIHACNSYFDVQGLKLLPAIFVSKKGIDCDACKELNAKQEVFLWNIELFREQIKKAVTINKSLVKLDYFDLTFDVKEKLRLLVETRTVPHTKVVPVSNNQKLSSFGIRILPIQKAQIVKNVAVKKVLLIKPEQKVQLSKPTIKLLALQQPIKKNDNEIVTKISLFKQPKIIKLPTIKLANIINVTCLTYKPIQKTNTNPNTEHYRDLVKDFHLAYGNHVKAKGQSGEFEDLRWSLVKEKKEEFDAAWKALDLVEQLDALVDLLYVTLGACVTYGIFPKMAKLKEGYGITEQVTDFLESHTGAKLTQNKLNTFDANKKHTSEYLELIGKFWKDYGVFVENTELLIEVIYKYAERITDNFQRAFEEVHRSNMTKGCYRRNSKEVQRKSRI